MNAQRRKALATIVATLEAVATDLESLRDDEQDYYDSMPEGLQGSERGEMAEASYEAMNEALDTITQAVEYLGEASE